jgi:2,4-dienoyl-CoA reductase-like NADH-dependent reductase (Old Yellow Enzyme family)
LFLAPINTGFAADGVPTDDLYQFYVSRSSPESAITVIGNVATMPQLAANASTAVLSAKSFSTFRKIAREIRNRGSVPGIQLAEAPPLLAPRRRWRAESATDELTRLRKMIESLNAIEIREDIRNFIQAAARATEAEFGAIQIHAAHGYLLSLLLNRSINQRRDDYRHDGEWVAKFVSKLRSTVGDENLLSFRINVCSGIQAQTVELNDAMAQARTLSDFGVDLIDLSAGLYTLDRNFIYPAGKNETTLPYYTAAAAMASKLKCVVAFAGNVRDIRLLPQLLPVNMMVSAARAFIADPQFATKSAQGRFDEIISCTRCNRCHYFSRGKLHIECGVNLEFSQN